MSLLPFFSKGKDCVRNKIKGFYLKARYLFSNKLTIIVLSPENGPVRQVQVPLLSKLIIKAAAGVIFVLTIGLVFDSFYLHHYIALHQEDYAKADVLQSQLQEKNTEIANLTQKNSNLSSSSISDMKTFESQALSIINSQRSRNGISRGLGTPDQGLSSIIDQNDLTLNDHLELLQQLYNASVKDQNLLDHFPSILPLGETGIISSPFGYRYNPFGGRSSEFHDGVDFACDLGTPVHAAADGVVTFAGWDYTYGRKVEINHGNGIVTFYGHNSRLVVSAGQQVKKGDLISYSGNTGRSSGPHLHYGMHVSGSPVNPLTYAS
ncbi:MAG: Murein DD-endopeptidase MepM [Candidatus Dichloromethanomonas elyunquensis]|nr:MAG: Murein DD-endopeptidase MepM [Candidatus Dichloromethanomonas elyunquensis]